MSIAVLAPSTPADLSQILTTPVDADFERRWVAWQARGLAHDRSLRRRFVIIAQAAGLGAIPIIGAYLLLA